MIYPYRNSVTGEIIEHICPAADYPGETATFGDVLHHRVYTVPVGHVKRYDDGAIRTKGQDLPVAKSLPLDTRKGPVVTRFGTQVRANGDGTYSTLKGERIIDGKESRRKHLADTGYVDAG